MNNKWVINKVGEEYELIYDSYMINVKPNNVVYLKHNLYPIEFKKAQEWEGALALIKKYKKQVEAMASEKGKKLQEKKFEQLKVLVQ